MVDGEPWQGQGGVGFGSLSGRLTRRCGPAGHGIGDRTGVGVLGVRGWRRCRCPPRGRLLADAIRRALARRTPTSPLAPGAWTSRAAGPRHVHPFPAPRLLSAQSACNGFPRKRWQLVEWRARTACTPGTARLAFAHADWSGYWSLAKKRVRGGHAVGRSRRAASGDYRPRPLGHKRGHLRCAAGAGVPPHVVKRANQDDGRALSSAGLHQGRITRPGPRRRGKVLHQRSAEGLRGRRGRSAIGYKTGPGRWFADALFVGPSTCCALVRACGQRLVELQRSETRPAVRFGMRGSAGAAGQRRPMQQRQIRCARSAGGRLAPRQAHVGSAALDEQQGPGQREKVRRLRCGWPPGDGGRRACAGKCAALAHRIELVGAPIWTLPVIRCRHGGGLSCSSRRSSCRAAFHHGWRWHAANRPAPWECPWGEKWHKGFRNLGPCPFLPRSGFSSGLGAQAAGCALSRELSGGDFGQWASACQPSCGHWAL